MNADFDPILECIRNHSVLWDNYMDRKDDNMRGRNMTDIFNEKNYWLMPWNANEIEEIWAKRLRFKYICTYYYLLELWGYLEILYNFSKIN